MNLFEDKSYKKKATVLLAAVTVLGSLIVFFNTDSTNRGASASRESRILGIQYLTHLSRSLWEAAAEKDIISSYQELSLLMIQMAALKPLAQTEAFLYGLTRDRLEKIQGLLDAQGEIMKPPYFNGQARVFDYAQYYVDRVFIPAVELLEKQEQKKNESAFWGSKSNVFTAGIAIFAVAVFLLTLSIILSGKIRFLFAGVGLFLVILVAGLSAVSVLRRWESPQPDAAALFARASGLALRAQAFLDLGGDLVMTNVFADQAATEIRRLLEKDPDYTAALQLRSRVHIIKGEAALFSGSAEAGQTDFHLATADLARILRKKKKDPFLYWSKGFAELVRKNPEAALPSIDQALRLLPEQKFALGLLKAVAQLFGGEEAESRETLEDSIRHAHSHPLASDPLYFRLHIRNLERLAEVWPMAGLAEMERRLKEAFVSVAICGRTHPLSGSAFIAPPVFVAPSFDAYGDITSVKPQDVFFKFLGRAYYIFEFKGLEKGQRIVQKVYRRLPGQVFWIEILRLDRVEDWTGPSEGKVLRTVEYPIPESGETLLPGDYRLEFYVEGKLLAEARFSLQP
jgi:tetratricopeptide (TPR) repeat protein